MRNVSAGLALVVLLGAAFLVYLQSQDAKRSLDAVERVATRIREPGVVGRDVDRATAEQIIASIDSLLAEPQRIADHVDELKLIGDTAASWARAAPAPSADLRLAVSLRGAAAELRAYTTDAQGGHLTKARMELEQARSALAGNAPPGLATDGVRDQLNNLQRSQQERLQDLNDELAQ